MFCFFQNPQNLGKHRSNITTGNSNQHGHNVYLKINTLSKRNKKENETTYNLKEMKHGLGWIDPLQFGLLIQVGCPVDQVKGSKEQREGYSGNPVYLAHTVKGLLGLWRLGFWLLLGLIWGWRGAFGDRGQSRVPGRIGGKGRSSGSWVGCSVVLLQERLFFLLLLIGIIGERILEKQKRSFYMSICSLDSYMDYCCLKLLIVSFKELQQQPKKKH